VTTYLGTEVLLEQPNRVLSVSEPQQLAATVMDARTGLRKIEVRQSAPARSRELEMLAMDLGEAYELRQVLERRRGRQKAIWVPTWQRDLVLTAAAAAGSGTITVRECGYATRIWPHAAARRHLLLLAPGGATTLLRRVSVAVTDGSTETLTLVGPGGETTHGVEIAATWLVCFLRLMRLDRDEIAWRWRGGTAAVALPIREIPAEAPA